MFEELVRQLRACIYENIPCEKADCGYKPFGNEDCVDNLMRRAADAIEELSKQLKKREDTSWTEWDFTCDPEYRDVHFQKDEWGE